MTGQPFVPPKPAPHRYDKTCPCRACLEVFIRRQRALYGDQDPLAAARGVFNGFVISVAFGLVVVLLLLAADLWPWWPA